MPGVRTLRAGLRSRVPAGFLGRPSGSNVHSRRVRGGQTEAVPCSLMWRRKTVAVDTGRTVTEL